MVKFEDGYRIAYDELTDTLYLSVGNSLPTTSSYLDDDYVLIRKVDGEINGITIDGFQDRHSDGSWNNAIIFKYLPNFNPSLLSGIA